METNDHVENAGIDSNDTDVSRPDNTSQTDPIIDMDDTTGSDGGPSKDRFLGDSDETGDSSYSSQPSQSRSDTSRVSGMGLSDGTGTQSGGRSQY